MRLWSLHPQYLDRQGLLACWQETLLAQKVLKGETHGYRNHPQLRRFRSQPDPLAAIATYLVGLAEQAEQRSYHFDRSKINPGNVTAKISVTQGQVLYEWERLKTKLRQRDPERLLKISGLAIPEIHPLFQMVAGEVEPWEKIT